MYYSEEWDKLKRRVGDVHPSELMFAVNHASGGGHGHKRQEERHLTVISERTTVSS